MRTLVGLALGGLLLSGSATAEAPAVLAPGVHFIGGAFEPGSQPDGNSVVFETKSGPVVVDTGRHEAHTRALLEVVKGTGAPPAAIVNTHWHLDHVSGNALLRRAYPGVAVYATGAIGAAREGFLANYRSQLVDMISKTSEEEQKRSFEAEVARIDSGDAMMPSEVVTSDRVLEIGGRKLEVHVTDRAVTDADLWILDLESKVLVAGDLVTLPAPFLDTACPGGWRASLDAIARSKFEVLVPGHGSPMTRKEFETWRTGFGNLVDCSAGDGALDSCVDGWMADAKSLLAGSDPGFTRSMVAYYAELLRSKRLDGNCQVAKR